MNTLRNHLLTLLPIVALAFVLNGCEDPVPDDYIPELVIEGFLIAGEPLSNVKIYASQPIQDTFRFENAMIRDADVTVLENGTPIDIIYVADSVGGYYAAADTSFRVKYNSTYELRVNAIGKTATATATTRGEFNWIRRPKDEIQYPGLENENDRDTSLDISWERQSGVNIYVLAISNLDTLGYGEYLTPPTSDTNRRVREENNFGEGTLVENELTVYGAAFSNRTATVWLAFKWFGVHNIAIYAGDDAFQAWFSQVGFGRRSSYDYRRSNIKGGLGVWAGASKLSAPTFLLKDF